MTTTWKIEELTSEIRDEQACLSEMEYRAEGEKAAFGAALPEAEAYIEAAKRTLSNLESDLDNLKIEALYAKLEAPEFEDE